MTTDPLRPPAKRVRSEISKAAARVERIKTQLRKARKKVERLEEDLRQAKRLALAIIEDAMPEPYSPANVEKLGGFAYPDELRPSESLEPLVINDLGPSGA